MTHGILLFKAPKSTVVARQEAERLGVRLEPDAMLRFTELVGDNPEEITGEFEKLATFANGAEIDVAIVETMVTARHDDAPFRAQKMLVAVGHWTPADASRSMSCMHEADAAMKGMSRMPPSLVLERALAESL